MSDAKTYSARLKARYREDVVPRLQRELDLSDGGSVGHVFFLRHRQSLTLPLNREPPRSTAALS